jgi:hypothetical protein
MNGFAGRRLRPLGYARETKNSLQFVEGQEGFEPPTFAFEARRSHSAELLARKSWSIVSDLNRRFRHGEPVSSAWLDERCVEA